MVLCDHRLLQPDPAGLLLVCSCGWTGTLQTAILAWQRQGNSPLDQLRSLLAGGQTPVARAAILAQIAHAGQLDKQAQPYIQHPARVVERVRQWGYGDRVQQIAWLHDVVEDTIINQDHLIALGFLPQVVDGVLCLTRQRHNGVPERYHADFIARIVSHADACPVKVADLRDHVARLDGLPLEQRISLSERYHRALAMLDPMNQWLP